MISMRSFTCVFEVIFTFCCAVPATCQWNPINFQPNPAIVSPFGYGPVVQYLSHYSTQTGSAICLDNNPSFKCLSVSGGNTCANAVPDGELISCGIKLPVTVNEWPFQPVDCNGHPSGDGGISGLIQSQDWCLIANYMPGRIEDTWYQYNDWLRLGVNRRFGGSIFELYGSDKLDRILQNGGGGVQISLWAFNPNYALPQYQRFYYAVSSTATAAWKGSYNSTPYGSLSECEAANLGLVCELGVAGPNLLNGPEVYPCAPNGAMAGSPINPIQAASTTCDWGLPSGAVDTVLTPGPGLLTISKAGPANYTRSDALSSLTWQQTSRLMGPCAIITYKLNDNSSIGDMDFQEIPAIWLHQGLGAQVYYYAGSQPYADVAGPVSLVLQNGGGQFAGLQLPGRVGPFGTGATAQMSEDWVSDCDSSGTQCITAASFSSTAQDFIVNYNYPKTSYMGVHGFFSLLNALNRSTTLFLCPYRFDQVVDGQSIRSWIYQFHRNPVYRW